MAFVTCPHCQYTFRVAAARVVWEAAKHLVVSCAVCAMLFTAGEPPRQMDLMPHQPSATTQVYSYQALAGATTWVNSLPLTRR